jgi:hypothetical protein
MQKHNKSKTTTIGSSDTPIHVNDVGSPHLHKHHEVVIRVFNNTRVGRAVVLDQHLIDVLFHKDLLDTRQHNVCDKYLGIISKSGCFAQSSSAVSEKIFTTGSRKSVIPKSCILLGVQRNIKNICGNKKEGIFWKLMTENPNRINHLELSVIKECADALLTYWYISPESPVSLFQQSLLNPS